MTHQSITFLPSAKGASIMQYAMGLGLVALLTLGTLLNVGDQVRALLTQTLSMGQQRPILAGQVPSSGTGGSLGGGILAGSGFGIGGVLPSPGPGERRECFFTGFCINVPVYDASPGAVEPIGTDGGDRIHAFSRILEDLSKQLEAMDPPHDQLAGLIRDAANTGHTQGDLLTQLDTQATGNPQVAVSTNFYKDVDTAYKGFSSQMNLIYDYLSKNPDVHLSDVEAILRFEHRAIVDVRNGFHPLPSTDPANTTETTFGINHQNTKLVHQSANNICDTRYQFGYSTQPCHQ